MNPGSIFNTAKELANKSFGVGSLTPLRLIYGYAKLITMNEDVLRVLFSAKEEQEELVDIKHIFGENEVDIELLKQAAPLFLYSSMDEATKAGFDDLLSSADAENNPLPASGALQQLFKMKIPEIPLMKKGHNLDDVIAYIDKVKDSGDRESKQDAQSSVSEKRMEEIQKPEVRATDSRESALTEKKEGFKQLSGRTRQLYSRVMSKVKGQNEAIRMFAQGYFQSEVLQEEEKDRKGPSASFLFAGPPGVGKTFLASVAASILKLPFLRMDMSEYSSEASVHTLTGYPDGFRIPKEGVLTGFVNKNPRCVVLLDEIEKAHLEIIYQFLQVLDGGTLTDNHTSRSVDFKNTILIFTTNAGKSLYQDRDRLNLSALSRSVVLKAIEEERDTHGQPLFPTAMCSRFAAGNLIMFNHLDVRNLLDIIQSDFSDYADKIRRMYGFDIELDDKLSSLLLYAQSTGMDARNISSQSVIFLKNELYEFGRHISMEEDSLDHLERLRFRVDLSDEKEQITDLFTNSETCNVLFVGNDEDLRDVPFSPQCNIHFVSSKEDAIHILGEADIACAIIDPMFGTFKDKENFLSLDDRKSIGISTFEQLRENFPGLPVYMLEKEKIRFEDKSLFLERGARGFLLMSDKLEFSNELMNICDTIYLQKKVDELSGKSRVLTYNTAQRFIEDGKTAEIIFYDFRIKLSAGAGENRLILSDAEKPKDRFQDVIGAENAKSELQYFINYMKNPRKYMGNGIKVPKGILLYGPPGTGKTMLARAMAGESEVTFFPATAAGFLDKYVGEGESKIRNLFSTAKKFAPSIIFIDEIDAIGKERTGSSSTQHVESLLNTLLTEMDGFEVHDTRPVFVIAATNYDLDGTSSGKASRIDPALIRRFDNRIYVDLPKEDEREQFIRLQLEKIADKDVSDSAIHNVAQRTTGESLAVLKNILELALRNAGKKGEALNGEYLLNALEEYMYGEKQEWNENYYRSVSVHESGHAYICSLSGEKPSYVTIVSRGNFGGYMQHENAEQTPSYSKNELLWKIRTALAGRAAELEFFGEGEGINTGVSSDFQQATNIAMGMICKYAMLEDQYVSISPETILRSDMAGQLMTKTNEILKAEMEQTRALVREGRSYIEALADYLMKNNHATEGEIADIFGGSLK